MAKMARDESRGLRVRWQVLFRGGVEVKGGEKLQAPGGLDVGRQFGGEEAAEGAGAGIEVAGFAGAFVMQEFRDLAELEVLAFAEMHDDCSAGNHGRWKAAGKLVGVLGVICLGLLGDLWLSELFLGSWVPENA